MFFVKKNVFINTLGVIYQKPEENEKSGGRYCSLCCDQPISQTSFHYLFPLLQNIHLKIVMPLKNESLKTAILMCIFALICMGKQIFTHLKLSIPGDITQSSVCYFILMGSKI